MDGLKPLDFVDSEVPQDDPNPSSLETTNEQEKQISMESVDSRSYPELESLQGVSIPQVDTSFLNRSPIPFENPKDMMARWELDNLDQKNIVKDALLSGRLPLAVLKLHLHRQEDTDTNKDPNDTFEKVRDIGRAIVYDLFLKVVVLTH